MTAKKRPAKPPSRPGKATKKADVGGGGGPPWNLRLYVAGRSPKSEAARANLQRLCEEHIPGRYSVEVIDLVAQPHLAKADQILAIPTLVRKLPSPMKRVIGDLSNSERAMVALDLKQLARGGGPAND